MSQPTEPQQTTPADPVTALGAGTISLHEVFRSFLAAGFTEQQAMYLTNTQWAEFLRYGFRNPGVES